jgi:hypothetical protein
MGGPGVVDQQRDRPELGLDLPDQAGDRPQVGDVERPAPRDLALGLHRPGRLGQLIL